MKAVEQNRSARSAFLLFSQEAEGDSHMVTNYPQQLTATGMDREAGTATFAARVLNRIVQLLCGVRGHDAVLHFEAKRVTMRCTSCGHDTTGWEIGDRAPRRRFEGDAQRHRMKTSPHLVLRKSA